MYDMVQASAGSGQSKQGGYGEVRRCLPQDQRIGEEMLQAYGNSCNIRNKRAHYGEPAEVQKDIIQVLELVGNSRRFMRSGLARAAPMDHVLGPQIQVFVSRRQCCVDKKKIEGDGVMRRGV